MSIKDHLLDKEELRQEDAPQELAGIVSLCLSLDECAVTHWENGDEIVCLSPGKQRENGYSVVGVYGSDRIFYEIYDKDGNMISRI